MKEVTHTQIIAITKPCFALEMRLVMLQLILYTDKVRVKLVFFCFV